MTVAWVPDEGSHEGQNRARVSYAITRKVGTAVVRNRVRRRLRAVNRELAARMRPGSYLMTARSEAASMPYDQLRASVGEALDALAADGEEAGARSSR
ncbi:MAG: ribonuclease P protein component [Actinomycetota bacterium]|nr:ribonuclease P protein component [Actinomycetota bacterium]